MNKKLYVLSISFILILGTFSCIEVENTDGFMFRGDLYRSGVYESKVPNNNTLLWSFDTGIYRVQSSPVVVDGRIFFGSDDNNVYCLDALTGDEIWNFSTEGAVGSTPAVVDGVVYVGSADRNLYAIDAVSKEKLWNYTYASSPAQITSSPAVVNNMIFFASDDNNFYALNISKASTPELEWVFPTGNGFPPSEYQSSPAVLWPYVYFGSIDGNLYCVWANNGTQKWAFEMEDGLEIYTTPTIYNGSIYIGGADYKINGALYCLDAQTGEEKWRFLPPGEGRFSEVYSSAAVHDDIVFIHAWHKTPGPEEERGTVFAIRGDLNGDGNITNNEIKWSFITWDDEGGSSPTVADGKVLVGSTNKKLYCIDEYTGEELWNLTTGGQIVASPTVAYGIVYITSEDGTLYAIGGDEPAYLEVEIIPEFPSIKSNRVMGISFNVTYRGFPIEGAFINFEVDLGNLSQSGASTFEDGSQRIKYNAPEVSENTTVTVHAKVTKPGYPEGNSTASFVVEPPTSYKQIKSSSMFSLSKYWLYLVAIFVLVVINVVIMYYAKRKKSDEAGKSKVQENVGE
ncbi:MAG: PQQ-binding-like beta-propeller repeat protein [Thermoplasmata archaeon]|nr:MAG: PQQ-binding-like beta-propeller repeat protein [Thermoplasmata archaeon]